MASIIRAAVSYGADVLAGASGVAFAVLMLAGAFWPERVPAIDSEGSVVVKFYARQGSKQQMANVLLALSAIPFLFFLSGLTMAVLYSEHTGTTWVMVPTAGAVALALGLAGTAVFQAQALRANGEDPKGVALAELIARTMRNLAYLPQAALIITVSWALWQGGGASWLADLGAAVAGALLVGCAPLLAARKWAHMLSLLALLGLVAWYGLAGIALMMGNL